MMMERGKRLVHRVGALLELWARFSGDPWSNPKGKCGQDGPERWSHKFHGLLPDRAHWAVSSAVRATPKKIPKATPL